ncbi:MAG: NAD(P)/FAD-dependent oxidoreductase [Opitutaceae bacterium]|nr:NAD(P)/FAD-dependent oxidoreductase [Opitutaceae bacterium]
MSTTEHYDVVIIGAGMSGLAAGIRLAHFGKNVCIFERHNAAGGLNSFYSFAGRKYDVGLHAMTNYVPAGVKGTPLGKLLRQLRIKHDELDLCSQKQSRIAIPGTDLSFSNDFALLENQVAEKFPGEVDGFRRLIEKIKTFDDVALDIKEVSARKVIAEYITEPLLVEMLLCPLMFYGSAREQDMDFSQFVIMAKAIFLEGFARPHEGVRRVIRILLEKYRQAGGKRKMKCGVRQIIREGNRAGRLLLDNGDEITADHVISSIGSVETEKLYQEEASIEAKKEMTAGVLSFVETITVFDQLPEDFGWGDETIVFFNDSETFTYACPQEQVDPRSGVICFPNNFEYGDRDLAEGFLRVTCLANYDQWATLPEKAYTEAKTKWFDQVVDSACRFLPKPQQDLNSLTVATDMFTPRTIHKFTGHLNGAVYGAPHKIKNGRTSLENLYLCGTDQGFLGIVGSMLSGISMANFHILQARK